MTGKWRGERTGKVSGGGRGQADIWIHSESLHRKTESSAGRESLDGRELRGTRRRPTGYFLPGADSASRDLYWSEASWELNGAKNGHDIEGCDGVKDKICYAV